jgi:hypothetical protein
MHAHEPSIFSIGKQVNASLSHGGSVSHTRCAPACSWDAVKRAASHDTNAPNIARRDAAMPSDFVS